MIVKSRIFNCLHHLRVVEISLDLALTFLLVACLLVAPFACVVTSLGTWTLLVMACNGLNFQMGPFNSASALVSGSGLSQFFLGFFSALASNCMHRFGL